MSSGTNTTSTSSTSVPSGKFARLSTSRATRAHSPCPDSFSGAVANTETYLQGKSCQHAYSGCECARKVDAAKRREAAAVATSAASDEATGFWDERDLQRSPSPLSSTTPIDEEPANSNVGEGDRSLPEVPMPPSPPGDDETLRKLFEDLAEAAGSPMYDEGRGRSRCPRDVPETSLSQS